MDVSRLRGYIEDVIRRKRPDVTAEHVAKSIDLEQGWFRSGTTRLELRADGTYDKAYDLPAMAGREPLTVREHGTWTREGTTVLLRVAPSDGGGLTGGAPGGGRVDRLDLVDTWLVVGGVRGIWWMRAR